MAVELGNAPWTGSPRDASASEVHHHLARLLALRWQLRGDERDLSRAIRNGERALALLPPDDPHRVVYINDIVEWRRLRMSSLTDVMGRGFPRAAEEGLRKLATAARERATVRRTPGLDELDPVPHAAIEQAKRRAALRTRLLESGALTIAAIADGRRQIETAARRWVLDSQERGRIFTVEHDGQILVPAFLLDEDLEPRPSYAGAIEALTTVGSAGWALWAWFASPSSWLDGEVPAEVALIDADAVTRAAKRRASNAA